jgi:hypothetical protein
VCSLADCSVTCQLAALPILRAGCCSAAESGQSEHQSRHRCCSLLWSTCGWCALQRGLGGRVFCRSSRTRAQWQGLCDCAVICSGCTNASNVSYGSHAPSVSSVVTNARCDWKESNTAVQCTQRNHLRLLQTLCIIQAAYLDTLWLHSGRAQALDPCFTFCPFTSLNG